MDILFRTIEFSHGLSNAKSEYSKKAGSFTYNNNDHFLRKEPYDYLLKQMTAPPAKPGLTITYLLLDGTLEKAKDFTAKEIGKQFAGKPGEGTFKRLMTAIDEYNKKEGNKKVEIGKSRAEIFLMASDLIVNHIK